MSQSPLKVSPLVSTQWLAEKISSKADNLRILDCSWHFAHTKRDAREEYNKSHIPGAHFVDIEECVDKSSPYDNMLPSEKEFDQFMGNYGIDSATHVIVYDNNNKFGLFSAPRIWWVFRVFGHDMVSVLNGGLPKWNKDGYATTDQVDTIPEGKKGKFTSKYNPQMVVAYEQVEKNIKEPKFKLVDARSPGRFGGTMPEPRPGTKPGHILGAVNVPYYTLLDPETKILKTPEQIKESFAKGNVDIQEPFVASCGSAVSACVLVLGAFLCGKENAPLYDGAWVEWYERAPAEYKVDVPV